MGVPKYLHFPLCFFKQFSQLVVHRLLSKHLNESIKFSPWVFFLNSQANYTRPRPSSSRVPSREGEEHLSKIPIEEHLDCLTNPQTCRKSGWTWGFDTWKRGNKAANSICNVLFSLNIARARPSACAAGAERGVGITTGGISCQTLKRLDSIKKFMRTRLS